jgi:hypothetical protein
MSDTELIHRDAPEAARTSVDVIKLWIEQNDFQLDADDELTIESARDLAVVSAEDYSRGWQLLDGLKGLDKRMTTHYERFKKPLNALRAIVLGMGKAKADPLEADIKALNERLVAWKAEADRLDAIRVKQEQAEADARERERNAERAAAIERVAAQEPDTTIKTTLQQEATAVRSAPAYAAPVSIRPTAPKVNGHFTRTWSGEVDDLHTLMKAWVEGRIFLSDDLQRKIAAVLGPTLNDAAKNLQHNIASVWPGCKATYKDTPVSRGAK